MTSKPTDPKLIDDELVDDEALPVVGGGVADESASDEEATPAAPSLDSGEPIKLVVESRAHGWRLDHYLCRLYPNYSRALFQKAISQGQVTINGLAVQKSRRLRVNDCLSVSLPEEPDSSIPPENIPLDVLFEDEHLVVINKAAGMIVHPGKGNYGGTLAGALQHHFDQLSDVAGQHRPGIVHRLDRNTSGVLVVAKNNQVHHRLSRQFEQRTVKKEYRAVVWGKLNFDSDFVETHVRVHPKRRERMIVCEAEGNAREAVTFYEVLGRVNGMTYVKLLPKTGRTHQLRVHMEHLGHPMIADRLYGGKGELNWGNLIDMKLIDALPDENTKPTDTLIRRQALHAFRLEFEHPESGQAVAFEAPLPKDMLRTVALFDAK